MRVLATETAACCSSALAGELGRLVVDVDRVAVGLRGADGAIGLRR